MKFATLGTLLTKKFFFVKLGSQIQCLSWIEVTVTMSLFTIQNDFSFEFTMQKNTLIISLVKSAFELCK